MIRNLAFVELQVADWPAALAWDRDVLGLPVVLRVKADRFALLKAGPGQLALRAGRPQPGSVLLAFEVEDLPAALEHLARLGVQPEAPLKASPEGYRRALLRDPDGYRLCLYDLKGCEAAHTRAAGAPGRTLTDSAILAVIPARAKRFWPGPSCSVK